MAPYDFICEDHYSNYSVIARDADQPLGDRRIGGRRIMTKVCDICENTDETIRYIKDGREYNLCRKCTRLVLAQGGMSKLFCSTVAPKSNIKYVDGIVSTFVNRDTRRLLTCGKE